jgi:hypothetical protein
LIDIPASEESGFAFDGDEEAGTVVCEDDLRGSVFRSGGGSGLVKVERANGIGDGCEAELGVRGVAAGR